MMETQTLRQDTFPKRAVRYWIYAFLIVGTMLRVWGVKDKCFWIDELAPLYVADKYEDILPYCKKGNTPPVRYYMMYYLQQLRPAETYVRIPSMLFGILALPVFFLLLRRVFGYYAAVIGTTLLTFNSWHVFHSQDARMYTVFLFFVIVSIYCMILALEKEKIYYWILFGVTMALNAYFTYFALWVNFIFFIFLGIVFLVKLVRKETFYAIHPASLFKRALIGFLVAGIVYAPWSINLTRLLKKYDVSVNLDKVASNPSEVQSVQNAPPSPPADQQQTTAPPPEPTIFDSAFMTIFDLNYMNGMVMKLGSTAPVISYGLFCFFILGLVATLIRRRDFFLLTLLWFIVPIVVLIIMSVRFFFPHRYLIFYLPVYLMLVSLGVVETAFFLSAGAMGKKLGSIVHTSPCEALHSRGAKVFIAFVLIIAVIFFTRDNLRYYRQQKMDWKGAIEYLESQVNYGDVIVTGRPWTELGLDYYHRDDSKRVLVIINCFELKKFLEVVRKHPDLWYINWGPLPEPVRPIVNYYLIHDKKFPGLLGDINIYRKKQGNR